MRGASQAHPHLSSRYRAGRGWTVALEIGKTMKPVAASGSSRQRRLGPRAPAGLTSDAPR